MLYNKKRYLEKVRGRKRYNQQSLALSDMLVKLHEDKEYDSLSEVEHGIYFEGNKMLIFCKRRIDGSCIIEKRNAVVDAVSLDGLLPTSLVSHIRMDIGRRVTVNFFGCRKNSYYAV